MTPWTVACRAPLSTGFPRQKYWSGLPFPSPGDLPDPEIEPESPALQADSLLTELHLIIPIYRDRILVRMKVQRRQWHPTPVLLPGKSHGWRSLVGYSPWDREESYTTERLHFHFHALEREMATHSSILAWRIPGMGEPGGLPSMGSHRVRHG